MKTGIVILNYNTFEYASNLVNACISIDCINEIVIVDNSSTDGSGNRLRLMETNRVTFIQSETNLGYAKGNNLGLEKLTGKGCDICIVANPDSYFERDLIAQIIETFSKYPQYGVLTTARRSIHDEKRVSQYWELPSKVELIMENFTLYAELIKKRKEIYEPVSNNIYEIGVAPGSLFAVRASLLKQVNYLDPNTFLYFEENCFKMRIKDSGYSVGYIPSVYYTCLDRSKNSTNDIQKKSTYGRRCYCKSKEYFARQYMDFNFVEMLLLLLTNRLFVAEKWLYLKVKYIFGCFKSIKTKN